MNRRSRIFIIVILVLSYINVLSQQVTIEGLPEYDVRHFTDENGLPQNSVYSIAEDELGNVWLGTERGLARFDGRDFTVFDNFGKTYSAAVVRSFHVDPRATGTGFLAMNDEQNFIHIHQGRAVMDTSIFLQMAKEPFPYPKKGTGYVSERLPTLFFGNPYPNFFVFPTGKDRFFIYDTKSLYYYENKRKIAQMYWKGRNLWRFFRLDNSLYYFENGKLTRFVAGQTPFEGKEVRFRGALIHDPSYREGKHLEIFWNNAMNQIFATVGKSLYHIRPLANGDLTSELIVQGFDLQKEEIKAVYYNQETRRIFLGSQVSGLFVLTKHKFVPLTASFAGADQVYYGQALIDKSSVISSQGIIYSLDRSGNKTAARQLPLVTSSVVWDKTSILVDNKGFIWCKHRNRLMVIEPDGSRIKFSWMLPSEISQLYQGTDQTIWVGTQTKGLFFLKAPFSNLNSPILFLKGPLTKVSWIAEQSADTIWIGTDQGLFRVSRKTRAVSGIKGLRGMYVRSLHLSGNQTEIWITTYKDGFFLLKNGTLTHFPPDRKGYLASSHCIVEDSKGFLWITTNHGLFQVLKTDLLDYAEKPRELYYHLYSKTDGFNSNEFNGGCQPCAVRLPSGFVSMPSMNGLIWFRPEKTIAEVPDKKIIINQIEIDRKVMPIMQKQVCFLQSQKQLRLQVSTPFLGNHYNVEFSYTLQERGKAPSPADWLIADAPGTNTTTINISTLPKGVYTLYVRKMNGFGKGNYGYETVEIDVPPFWYQTWWFYLFVVFASVLCSFLYSKYRIRTIRQRNRLLEQQINERTSQLKITLHDLEKSQNGLLSQIHLQSRLMASIAHDVRTPLQAAIVVAEEIRKFISRQQYEQVAMFSQSIGNALIRVNDSLEGLLAYVKVQVYKREITKNNVFLHELVRKNFRLYGEGTKVESNTFVNDVPEDLTVSTNQQLLDIILQNIVDNANKFTDGGTIKAYVRHDAGNVTLVIEDTGHGISEPLQRWFNDLQLTSIPPNYNGIGLVIVRELASLVTEELQIRRLEAGTEARLVFRANADDPMVTGASDR